MANTQIRNVSILEMGNLAAHLSNIIDLWDIDVKKIDTAIRELDKMWNGEANDAFMKRWENDLINFGKLKEVLDEYCDMIFTARKAYADAEEQISDIVSH